MESQQSETADTPQGFDQQLISELWGEHLTLSSSKQRDVRRQLRRHLYEKSLIDFGKAAWPIIEPGRDFIPGKHIDAICEHLEAVTRGQIKRLVLNIPPGSGKSVWVSALWPVWSWTNDPHSRWLFSSYTGSNTIRDSRKRRELIKSQWYRNHWWSWRIKDDQDTAHRFENNKQGFMLATSTGSGATGEHCNFLVCLPGDVKITTSAGRLSIHDIVDRKQSVQVLGYDHTSHATKWCNVEAYESTTGRKLLRITTANGETVECTDDHPVYTESRGYIRADSLQIGDEVLIHGNVCVQKVRKRLPSKAEHEQNILQSQMLATVSSRAEYAHMPAMRTNVLPVSISLCEMRGCARGVLQPQMPWAVAGWRRSSAIQERTRQLRSMRERHLFSPRWRARSQVLFRRVSKIRRSRSVAKQACRVCVQALRQDNHADRIQGQAVAVLLKKMLFICPSGSYSRGEKRKVYSRAMLGAVSTGVQEGQRRCSSTRREMFSMRDGCRKVRQRENGCSPYRLQQAQQQTGQSCDNVSLVSRENARRREESIALDKTTIVAIDRVSAVPKRVFNLKVAECHNYFANGILVHNCDDPHDRMDRYSKVKRDEAINWYKTVFTSLNLGPDTRYVIVAQRITEDDMSGYVLANELGYDHLCIPLLYDSQHPAAGKVTSLGWRDWRTKDGEVMWPEVYPLETIARLRREKSSYDLTAQYQQNPTSDEGAMFPRANFQYFRSEGFGDDEVFVFRLRDGKERRVLASQCQWFQAADTALETNKSSAWTVVGTFAITPQPAALLIYDIARDRIPVPKQYGFLISQKARHPRVTVQYVEKKASGHGLIQEGAMRGTAFGALNPADKSKDMRMVPSSIQYENGVVYHRESSQAPWLPDFENELAGLPDSEYRDQCDVVGYAGIIFQRFWLTTAYASQSLASVGAVSASGVEIEPAADTLVPARQSLAEQLTGRGSGAVLPASVGRTDYGGRFGGWGDD